MEISYLFNALWRKKWVLILIPLIAGITALTVKNQMPKKYKSTAQLSTGFTIDDQIKLNDERFNPYDANNKFNNLLEMMKSPIVVNLLSYNLMLHDFNNAVPFYTIKPENFNLNNNEKAAASNYITAKLDSMTLLTSFNETERHLINIIKLYGYDYKSLVERLSIRRLNFSDFIVIEYVSENPQLSAFVVNSLTREFIRYNNFAKSRRTGESVDFFAQLVEQKKAILDEKSDALKIFKSTNSVLNFGAESESKIKQIRDLESSREYEKNKIYGIDLSIAHLTGLINGTEVSASGKFNSQHVLNLRSRINLLNEQFINSGSRNQSLSDSLTFLRYELQNELSKANVNGPTNEGEIREKKNQLEIELAIAQSRLRSINNTIETLSKNISGFATTEATIAALDREVNEAADQYILAQEKFNASKLNSLVLEGSIKQVLLGQPAGEPEPSQTLIITGLATIVSFIFCSLTILFLEFMDTTIRSPSRFESLVDLNLLGYINNINYKGLNLQQIFNQDHKPEFIPFHQNLKKLRFEVESSKSKIILVTSTQQSEGKSFFIISLAFTLSLTNKKILIIDTNFKNNSLTKIFLSKNNIKPIEEHSSIRSNNINLFLSEKSTIEEKTPQGIISKTSLEGIDIISNRGGDYTPSEIFSQKNFGALLESLKQTYDYIFLEGSALNEFADTKELVAYSEGVLAIFSAGNSIKSADIDSIEYLRSLKAKFLGAILNKVSKEGLEN